MLNTTFHTLEDRLRKLRYSILPWICKRNLIFDKAKPPDVWHFLNHTTKTLSNNEILITFNFNLGMRMRVIYQMTELRGFEILRKRFDVNFIIERRRSFDIGIRGN